jgi:hypothetical protein
MENTKHPKLRPIDFQVVSHQGQSYIALQDPQGLSGKSLYVPQELAPVLELLDGTRDLSGLNASLMVRYGMRLPFNTLEQLIEALDDALLLENERSERAAFQILEKYRQAQYRSPALAGKSYSNDESELRAFMQKFIDAVVQSVDVSSDEEDAIRGLISPHIDFARGGPVYARVWKRAAAAVRSADLIVLLGTDHFGERHKTFTLTRQNYATPYGVLPTNQRVVDALADAIGEGNAFDGELRHQGEHSIELAAVWLHHIRGDDPPQVVPVLCGSFIPYLKDDKGPQMDPTIEAFLTAYREVTCDLRVVVVAAGDLAHIGPAFGGNPVDIMGRAQLQATDQTLIDRICAGDSLGFYDEIREVEDRNNVCGVAPIYIALRMLEPVTGQKVAYDRCPADEQGTSMVSICGVVFW